MKASVGDYIIKGLVGEYYPCKAEAFEQKYEAEEHVVSIGSLYDINKEAMAALPKLSRTEIKKGIKQITDYVKSHSHTYYMLLNKETSNYTLFNIKDHTKLDKLASELKVCLRNRGVITSIEPTKDGIAFEIWLRVDGEEILYYFFPYDLGVIEVF